MKTITLNHNTSLVVMAAVLAAAKRLGFEVVIEVES